MKYVLYFKRGTAGRCFFGDCYFCPLSCIYYPDDATHRVEAATLEEIEKAEKYIKKRGARIVWRLYGETK